MGFSVPSKENSVRLVCGCFFILLFVAVLEIWPTVSYVHKTYFSEVSFEPHTRYLNRVPRIPRRIHQGYFNVNNDGLLDRYRFAQQSWLKLNPEFIYTLWNKSMVDFLVKTHYPHLYELYLSYPSWLNQNEVGRYVIIHHYGGVYADLDIECVDNMTSLIMAAFKKKRQVVLHLGDLDLASNDFFAATPQNPFLGHVISGLSDANRWYVFPYSNIMLTTGATYFHGRYRSYYYKGEILALSDVNKYIVHHHASSWHRWDGKVLIWFYRRGYVVKSVLLFVILLVLLKLYISYKRRKSNSMKQLQI